MAGLTAKPGAPSTSLQRLYHVEKRIVHTVDLAGGVMEELAKQGGPRSDVVAAQCHEFMQAVKEIQMTLRDEIKSILQTWNRLLKSTRISRNLRHYSRVTVHDSAAKDMETGRQLNYNLIRDNEGFENCGLRRGSVLTLKAC
ncbi:hypothetical protein R1flu_017712 [Riccia fluitans]|uniref:Mediator of RNA polymerase II transcription subunit 11 n=1 Tax=Riccia fluitans TaxID=41844 RepID=A0ABD1ZH50_9MARC